MQVSFTGLLPIWLLSCEKKTYDSVILRSSGSVMTLNAAMNQKKRKPTYDLKHFLGPV